MSHRTGKWTRCSPTTDKMVMMTSSNGNIFRVTGHLCREFTCHRWIPRTKAGNAELWCFLLCAPELSKQSWGWWCETSSRPLWHHCNGNVWNAQSLLKYKYIYIYIYISRVSWVLFPLLLYSLMMCGNNWPRYGLEVIFPCLRITLSHFHHNGDLPEDIRNMNCL